MRAPKPRSSPIDVLFVVVPHALLLDVAGPAEAFRLANLRRTERNLSPPFQMRFAGPVADPVTSVGLTLGALEPLPPRLNTPTWVVIAGQPSAQVGRLTEPIVDTAAWLRRTLRVPLDSPGSPHKLVTICSGTLLAARAGLADDRHCTTHHDLLGELREIAPRAKVVNNRVFMVDGAFASSAGITAGIDLALHLIAEECGEALAAQVAEDMVVYLRRSSSHPELSPFLAHRRHLHAAVHRVQDALNSEPEKAWDMPTMAAVGHVTERHLLRLFLRHAGISPLRYLQEIRLLRARQALEHGASVARAAEDAGFRSGSQMRRAWSRQWGGTPREAGRGVAAD